MPRKKASDAASPEQYTQCNWCAAKLATAKEMLAHKQVCRPSVKQLFAPRAALEVTLDVPCVNIADCIAIDMALEGRS